MNGLKRALLGYRRADVEPGDGEWGMGDGDDGQGSLVEGRENDQGHGAAGEGVEVDMEATPDWVYEVAGRETG